MLRIESWDFFHLLFKGICESTDLKTSGLRDEGAGQRQSRCVADKNTAWGLLLRGHR